MKKIALIICTAVSLAACTNKETAKGKFTVNGEIKNLPDQKVVLEQLYFSDKNPEVLDTAEIKNGKFSVTGTAQEEGLFRLRPLKLDAAFLFINDNPVIDFKADMKDVSLQGPAFN